MAMPDSPRGEVPEVTLSLVSYDVECHARRWFGLGRWGGLMAGALVGMVPASLIGGVAFAMVSSGPPPIGYTGYGQAVYSYSPQDAQGFGSVVMILAAVAGLVVLLFAGAGAHRGVELLERFVLWRARSWARRSARRHGLGPDQKLSDMELRTAVYSAAVHAED